MQISDFPEHIVRKCCPGKSCGNTNLTFHVDAKVVDGKPVLTYSYIRDNGDDYWYSAFESLEDLYKRVVDTRFYPTLEEEE